MFWRASDWDYRAEGGKHIVVYNAINRTVLRIIKADRGEKVSLKSEKAEIEKRLKYERHVISPILSEKNIQIEPGQLVFLPAKFISDLSIIIEPLRPVPRLGKIIPPGDRYAVIQADFTNNIGGKMPTIAMELKPKSGFIPTGRTSCQFCVTQIDKIRRGKYDARSGYCPIDLYSGNYHRKMFSLSQLLQNPQNNLRLFVEGKLAYSMETLDQIGSASCAKQFPEILEKICADLGGTCSLEAILHQLCNKLGSVPNLQNRHCQTSVYQQEGPINIVSNVGPLEVVQGLQRLSDKTPSMVLDSWNSLTQQEKLEIENPSSDWLNSVKKAKKDLNHIDIVRRHLISATAKDFSLIIAFTDLSDCKMQLVDLDCKPTSKLFEHVQKEVIWNHAT